jgi:hypothetical protein
MAVVAHPLFLIQMYNLLLSDTYLFETFELYPCLIIDDVYAAAMLFARND